VAAPRVVHCGRLAGTLRSGGGREAAPTGCSHG
jgi:hypothetical protein